jgi:1-acyl-sn-glycerol-3-phosphate acyltransferase
MVLGICRVKVDVVGAANLDPSREYVFCSNHFSLIDTPVVFGCMPREFRILARHGLWKIPFLGWHLNRAGHLPVHRENPRVAARNIQQAAEKVRAGYSVFLFPEGGRTREDRMRPFKPGAGYIAIRAGAAVVPMAIVGTRAILPPNSLNLRPGRAELRIGRPIPADGLEQRDAKELMARVRETILDLSQPRRADG